MLRREPQASLLFRAAGLLRQRLGRLVGRLAEDEHSRLGGNDLLPIRLRRMASPSVRSLEPRFVLNATAELNALGQLVVMGTDSAEAVELQVEADGRLRLRDAIGDVIPIAGHPDGAMGQSNSLDPLSITSKQIIFDMHGGDDVLTLDLPSGLDVTVTSSAGNDTATVGGGTMASITPGGLTVDSETIRIDPGTRSIAFGNAVDLTGDVSLGSIGETTELSFADGGLAVSGSFTVTGDVGLAGTIGPVDFSNAVVTSNLAGSDLSIGAMTGDVFFDGVDDSGGSSLNDLRINSAASVQFNGPTVELDGALVVRNVPGTTSIDSTTNAGSISIETQGDILSNSRLTTDVGGIELNTASRLVVNENLDTTLATVNGDVVFAGSEVQLNKMRVMTSGGAVRIEGNTTIDGLVIIDTGNRQGVETAGDVTFLGNVQSDAGITDVLRIDARGNQANGDFMVTGSIGNTPDAPTSVDLNGLIVDADRIAINSVGITSGDIRLTGNAITRLGSTIRTSTSGDILIDAPVQLGPANTTVFAVESVRFTQSVNGQRNTENLVINAGVSALFDDAISGIQELSVTAKNVARFTGPTTLDGAMNVEADSIRILGDVTTSDDAVNLRSTTQTLLTSGGIVAVGNAMITIDGGANAPTPGVIDVGGGTLSSTTSGDAVRLQNASSVLLGNTRVLNGNLLVSDITGSVTQSSGTNIIIDRLTALQTGPIDLSNAANDVRSIEEIAANGSVTVNDSVGGLVVNRVNSSSSDVTLNTVGDMQLGETAVTATGAVVQLQAGSINDVANASTDLSDTDITARRVELTAVSGIGNVNQVDLGSVSELRATTDSGGIDVAHIATGPLTVESLTANSGKVQLLQSGAGHALDLVSIQSSNGMINVVAEGTITAQNVVSSGMDQDISLTTTGTESDILVREIRAKNHSDVLLTAGDDILTTGDFKTSLIEADDLGLKANNGKGDQAEAIRLRTQVTDLVASTGNGAAPTAVNRGDIRIVELDSINLASSDAAGDEIVETANGQIDISAINITVFDTSLNDEGSEQKDDPEIDANGAMGRVVLNATSTLTLNADVQIHAEKKIAALPSTRVLPVDDGLDDDARAVLLVADAVVLGDNIEIFTGGEQGTARIFGPRPSVIPDDVTTERPIKLGSTRNKNAHYDTNNNLIPSAFFEPDSISVNVLEQAAVNDANGILTVDIGQSGENGLSVSIDWGAGGEDRRFQQLNNLSADKTISFDVNASGMPLGPIAQNNGPGTLSVTHFYTQADILDSRLNGRTSATAPLNVLFSVQQHQSIMVRGNTIVQNGVTDSVPKNDQGLGIISSTGNSSRTPNAEQVPGLESGSASFIIPSLSIPVAFFPVREVIPEIETPQFVVRTESKATISQSTVETVETVTASTSTREEYFRLRVLSPDPDGEDLAEPEKLPEDILDGEKLSALFKRLPDGTYEIEYVLGDGDERTILRVEIRNGAAKLSVGDLEEGVLKLKRLKDTE